MRAILVQFKLPGQEAEPIKWRTNKAQELFAYLLHHRDRTIDRSVLLDLLWPDFEEAKAARQCIPRFIIYAKP